MISFSYTNMGDGLNEWDDKKITGKKIGEGVYRRKSKRWRFETDIGNSTEIPKFCPWAADFTDSYKGQGKY